MKNLLEKLSRSYAGMIAANVVLMIIMICFLSYREKCEEEIWTLAGLGGSALILFGVSYRYFREMMYVRDAGYMGRFLTAAGAGILSLLLVLTEVALVCLIV